MNTLKKIRIHCIEIENYAMSMDGNLHVLAECASSLHCDRFDALDAAHVLAGMKQTKLELAAEEAVATNCVENVLVKLYVNQVECNQKK